MLSHEVASNSLWSPGPQRARLFCPPLSPRVFPNSCPLGQWCYLTISSTAATFSFCLQSFPASVSFPKSRLYTHTHTHTHTYTHTYIILFIFFSIMCYYKILSLVPHVIHIFFFFFFLILFHYSLLQNIEYSALCCKVGSCCFFIFCMVVYSCFLFPSWLKH